MGERITWPLGLHMILGYGHGRRRGAVAADANGLFPFGDFQLGDAGFFNQFDQFFDFTNIHERSLCLLVLCRNQRRAR
jgi:hypothetical protein